MISRRFCSSPSSLIVELLLLSSNRSCHRHCHLHRRGYCSLMAAVSPSFLGQGKIYMLNDKKGFHFLFQGTLIKPKSWNKNVVIKSVAGNDNSSNGGDYSSKSLCKGRRPRAIAPSMPQLVRLDSEKINGIVEENSDWFSNRGSCHTIGLWDEGQLEKMVVAVDVDEVLGNFVSALNKFIADRYSMNHSVSEYHVYEFFKIWNCSRVEADIRVHEFFKTSYFMKGIHPMPGALQALKKLSRFCSLSVVTSRQNAIKDHTIQWIEQHFPGLFQEIQFGNHFALDGQSRPKSDICRSLGASVLIDDNPRYAAECAEAGIKVLLFDYENSYPWSKSESVAQHPLVVKVHNWEEVEHHLVSHNVSRKKISFKRPPIDWCNLNTSSLEH